VCQLGHAGPRCHYFDAYKLVPGAEASVVIGSTYGRDRAKRVIETAIVDYRDTFGE
jgi:hypothetical protein